MKMGAENGSTSAKPIARNMKIGPSYDCGLIWTTRMKKEGRASTTDMERTMVTQPSYLSAIYGSRGFTNSCNFRFLECPSDILKRLFDTKSPATRWTTIFLAILEVDLINRNVIAILVWEILIVQPILSSFDNCLCELSNISTGDLKHISLGCSHWWTNLFEAVDKMCFQLVSKSIA